MGHPETDSMFGTPVCVNERIGNDEHRNQPIQPQPTPEGRERKETSMNEDSTCGKPCGLEPHGCYNCPEVTGVSVEELYRHNLAYDEDLEGEDYENFF